MNAARTVMPGIPLGLSRCVDDRDGRDKPGHDEIGNGIL